MGTNTDPYQWVEGRYKLMRGIWAALRDAANPCSVLTKSPLLLRDLDLMLEVAERTEISACLSVPTLEEKAWRASEPHTPHPRARLEAVAKLNAAGIPTGILIAPLLPGINDAPEQVERIIALATRGGRDLDRRPDAVPARRGARDLLRLAALVPARISCRATSGCTRAAAACRCASAARSSAPPGCRSDAVGGGSLQRARGQPSERLRRTASGRPAPASDPPAPRRGRGCARSQLF